MEKTLLIQCLGDTPQIRIIDFFLENRSDYSKKEIIENIGISKTTFYKVWDELMKFDIVRETRKYGKAQLYTLNEKNPIIKKLMALDAELGKQAMNKALEREAKLVKTSVSKTITKEQWAQVEEAFKRQDEQDMKRRRSLLERTR